jgi:hypothetical protein
MSVGPGVPGSSSSRLQVKKMPGKARGGGVLVEEIVEMLSISAKVLHVICVYEIPAVKLGSHVKSA